MYRAREVEAEDEARRPLLPFFRLHPSPFFPSPTTTNHRGVRAEERLGRGSSYRYDSRFRVGEQQRGWRLSLSLFSSRHPFLLLPCPPPLFFPPVPHGFPFLARMMTRFTEKLRRERVGVILTIILLIFSYFFFFRFPLRRNLIIRSLLLLLRFSRSRERISSMVSLLGREEDKGKKGV